jgi:uncharacterized damage-inducible protein DinB
VHPAVAFFARNAWANERLLNWCLWQPAAASASGTDVYGDVKSTFNHLLAAENRYLQLLTGELPADAVSEKTPRALEELWEPAGQLARRWNAVLATERDIDALHVRQRRDGRKVEMPDWLPLVQAVHHGDDHRAQIATLLGRSNVMTPELDAWYFGFEPPSPRTAPEWAETLLLRGAGHHLWATQKLLEHSASLGDEQLELDAPGTYGSIVATLNHLVSTDRGYLSRLKRAGLMEPLENATVATLRDVWDGQQEAWRAYFNSHPDYESTVECSDGWYPGWVLVAQAIHHGNDHRTHVGTVLLAHELQLPELDVWAYAEAEGVFKTLAAG